MKQRQKNSIKAQRMKLKEILKPAKRRSRRWIIFSRQFYAGMMIIGLNDIKRPLLDLAMGNGQRS